MCPRNERISSRPTEAFRNKRPQNATRRRHSIVLVIRAHIHEPAQRCAWWNVIVARVRQRFKLQDLPRLGAGEVRGRGIEWVIGDGVSDKIREFEEALVGGDAGIDAGEVIVAAISEIKLRSRERQKRGDSCEGGEEQHGVGSEPQRYYSSQL